MNYSDFPNTKKFYNICITAKIDNNGELSNIDIRPYSFSKDDTIFRQYHQYLNFSDFDDYIDYRKYISIYQLLNISKESLIERQNKTALIFPLITKQYFFQSEKIYNDFYQYVLKLRKLYLLNKILS